jgi:hypothetical protein
MKNKSSISLTNTSLFISINYVAAQIFSNIASSKIALIGGLSIDGGTIIYPITFTLRDLIHKSLGKKVARFIVFTAGLINAIVALLFWIVTLLPQDPGWGLQSEFALILGPVWRIVAASIVAQVAAELIDTEAYHFFVDKISQKHQWGRVLFSNAFSVPADSVIFCLIAFWGAMPMEVVISIIISNILVKGVVTIVSIPLIYTVPEGK